MDPMMGMGPMPPEPGMMEEPIIPELDFLALAQEAMAEPEYPAWLYKVDKKTGQKVLTPPKKPTQEACESWAKSDHILYGLLLTRFARDLAIYRQDNTAVFDLFDPEQDEAFVSIEPTVQVNKLANMIGSTPHRVSWPFRNQDQLQAAQDAEDWATHFIEQWERVHRQGGNGPLKWEASFSAALYGRICARVVPDPDDNDFPWKVDLMDPATCFPMFGDKWGLLRMTRIYRDTLGRVVDGYDPTGERGLHRKFTKHYLGKNHGGDTQLDYDREVEVVEVWTRWHRYVSVDSMQIMLEAHEYGRVPFVYIVLTGEMGMMATPDTRSIPFALTEKQINRGEIGELSMRQIDIARKGLAFFDSFRQAIRYEEMLYGLLMTLVKLDANPPMITVSPYDDVSRVDLRPGGHTKRRPGEATNPLALNSRANVIGPVATLVRGQQAKAGLPDNVFGVVEGSNVTGFAESTLLAAAKDRLSPYVEAIETFYADVLELAAYLFHGFGHLYVDNMGTLELPRMTRDPFGIGQQQMPPMPPTAPVMGGMMSPMDMMAGMPPMMPPPPEESDSDDIKISRKTFDLVGFRPRVILEGFDWQQMTQKANVAGLMIDKRIWSEWTARDKLGVENPTKEGLWIDVETAKKFPPLMEKVLLPQALWESGNIDAFMAYMTQVQQSQSQSQMGGMGMPGGGPPPGMGGGTPPGVQSVQGDSQPMIGPDGVPGRPRMQGEDVGP